jgi:hypothetical protein
MPYYIPNMLHKFQHAKPAKHQGTPHAWTLPTYGAKIQYATNDDDSPIIPDAKITVIQKKVGTLLYYAVCVDPFMLVALGTISSDQATATQLTKDECKWLMDYACVQSIIHHPVAIMPVTWYYTYTVTRRISARRARAVARLATFFSVTPPR